MIEQQDLPTHIGIIMDGNGRWAQNYKHPRNYGHQKGAKALEEISLYANELGIAYMTVYAFSTENWSRPKDEIDALMNLLRRYLRGHIKESNKNNLKVKVIGDRSDLPQDIQTLIHKLEEKTKDKNGMILNIALNYGGRDDIIRAINKMLKDHTDKKLPKITEELFEGYLDTASTPDPDLIIRTSGEQRLSNFLTWQSAYSEFYFTDCLWPDFNKEEFQKAIAAYHHRDRRFGKIK